ncbi:helix-turn-helix transcriptional regulator [bacterium]|nr:helix-turn-helix transcriptional regulator [bacterium]
MAREAGLSKYHCVRIFRDATGQTPVAALRERRMQAARELLVFTDLPIKHIARQVGYSDCNYFTHSYRRWRGRSPGGIAEARQQRSRTEDRRSSRLPSPIPRCYSSLVHPPIPRANGIPSGERRLSISEKEQTHAKDLLPVPPGAEHSRQSRRPR